MMDKKNLAKSFMRQLPFSWRLCRRISQSSSCGSRFLYGKIIKVPLGWS